MSTLTPNLNLVLPIGVEKVSRQIINTNMTLIDTAVGGKVNVSDIVNNLTTNDPTKVLSAAQGYALNSNLSQKLTYIKNDPNVSAYIITQNAQGILCCDHADNQRKVQLVFDFPNNCLNLAYTNDGGSHWYTTTIAQFPTS